MHNGKCVTNILLVVILKSLAHMVFEAVLLEQYIHSIHEIYSVSICTYSTFIHAIKTPIKILYDKILLPEYYCACK